MEKIAKMISRIFDPVLIVPVVLLGVVSLAFVNGYRWDVLLLILFLDALIPGIYVVVRYFKGGDWDFRNKSERAPLYVLIAFSQLLGVLVVYYLNIHPLAEILLGMWLLMLVFGGVNMFYKISVHTGVNSAFAFFVIFFFGWEYWWIWLVPLAVAWSRVYLRKHKLGQVILGGVVPPVFLGIIYSAMRLM